MWPFFISNIILGLRADLVYLIILLRLLINLGLVELQHLIYQTLLTEFNMLLFFTNLSLMEF